MQETQEIQVQSLGQEDLLEEEMAIHSTILALKIPWTEERGGMGSPESGATEHRCSGQPAAAGRAGRDDECNQFG